MRFRAIWQRKQCLPPESCDAKAHPVRTEKRMQGKACFNFSEADAGPFRKLADLTAAGFAGYRTKTLGIYNKEND